MFGDGLFGPITVSDELADLTGDGAWLRAMLDAEAALAGAAADAGLVPTEAADAIAECCKTIRLDVATIGRRARLGGNPVIPLVADLTAAVPDAARTWVHWGATSQDILDTAAALVARRASGAVELELVALADACATQAERHRGTLMAGRTLLQQAVPITFGLKAAGWLAGVLDARRMLERATDDLAVQLGGAAGTLASLGSEGPAVLRRYAQRLGLPEPLVPWHTARQRVAGVGAALGTVTATAAKICGDIALLMQTEVGEAAEPAARDRGSSSTLPHKRNPVAAAATAAAARRAVALVPLLIGAVVAEHERPVGAWQAEWGALGELLALAGGAVSHAAETVAGVEVDAERMAANLALTGGLVLAERVTFALAESMDRAEASRLVGHAARRAAEGEATFADALTADDRIAARIDRRRIDELLEPSGYLGATDVWIDRAIEAHHAAIAETRPMPETRLVAPETRPTRPQTPTATSQTPTAPREGLP